MRRRAILCVAFVLALVACSGDGVSIEVRRGNTIAERVELYVVDGHCTTDDARTHPCPQLKTPSARGYLDGEVYTRDDARTLDATIESDGAAYFTIKANGDETRIPLAVAVGFDGDDKRVGAVLMPFEFYTTDNKRHIVTLETIVEDKVTGTPPSDGLRAETWYQEPSLGGGCLALEHTKDGESDRKFIVPADDLDCDGWIEPQECDALWPNRGPDDDTSLPFTCVVRESSGGSGNRCLLGGAPCIDGEGPAECRPVERLSSSWCVPSALCDPLCGSSGNPQCLYGALKHPQAPPLKHPTYVRCKVPVREVSAAYTVCLGNRSASFDVPWAIPATTSCSQLSLGRVHATDLGPFSAVRTSTSAPSNTIRAMLLPPCEPALEFSGDFSLTANTDAVPEHVLKLDLTNAISLVVPLVVQLDPVQEVDCANAIATCEVVLADPDNTPIDESLDSCAQF